jgi:putative nucleotidyltransferase with HDIG domain
MLDRKAEGQVNGDRGETLARPPEPAADAASRAFRFLQELASDLSHESISFPTFIDATVRIRDALADPDADFGRVAQVVSGEPLLAARIVHLANSVAFNAAGRKVADVRSAVTRVGFGTVRTTAAAVALEQVVASKELSLFAAEAERVWRHSLDVAAIAYVLARALTPLRPDEALFAGLVHDIGRFYLLSRASRYPELVEHKDELETIVHEWHPSIGQAILQQLDLPEALTVAVAEHELGNYRFPPRNMTHLVTLANLAARWREGRAGTSADDPSAELPEDSPVFPVLAEASAEVQSLIDALR